MIDDDVDHKDNNADGIDCWIEDSYRKFYSFLAQQVSKVWKHSELLFLSFHRFSYALLKLIAGV